MKAPEAKIYVSPPNTGTLRNFAIEGAQRVVSVVLPPLPQAVADLGAHLFNAHALGNHQLAGDRGPLLSPLTHVVSDATILSVFVPAETAVGDRLVHQILQAP